MLTVKHKGNIKNLIRKDIDIPNAKLVADTIAKYGEYNMDVSQMISALAGLPPKMPIWAGADGVSMFINDIKIEQLADDSPPFLRIVCSIEYQPPVPPQMNKDEQVADKKQRAIQLTRNIEKANQMPEMEDA